MSPGSASSAFDLVFVTALYAGLTVVLTWPLAGGLTRSVPGDFGDPLFASWAIAWDATHLGRGWWNANIFAPHPLALAYSEHFLPQALQVLPVYLATKNPILCYNLLFLSTFVLSGLGMFLLGRELTGSREAGIVAGLAYAFAPYRIASIPHLQVLSSAWMPFVLFGLRRYFATGRTRPLAGAAAAWIAQNLSCGYYLLYFSPIVLFFLAWEMTTRRLWTDARTLARVGIAGAAVLVVTGLFLLPYLELRQLGFSPRSLTETRRFSADVYAYFTADPNLRFWGPIAQAWPKAEGLLFPGLTIAVLAATAVARSFATVDGDRETIARHGVGRIALRVAVAVFVLLIVALLLGWSIRLPGLKITSLARALTIGAGGGLTLLVASRRTRAAIAGWGRSPVAAFSLIALFAIAMSFGPDVRAKGRTVAGSNIYAAFYNGVPGFDGVRVPARFAMIVTLSLAALASIAISALDRRRQPRASVIAGALILLEAVAVPIPVNQNSTDYVQAGLAPLPASVSVAAVPVVYRFVAQLPSSAVVLELPLGEPAFDVRYMFYSTTHWKRLVNGYSGGAPKSYELLNQSLGDAATRPDRAWQAIVDTTATHGIVHEGYYTTDAGRRLSDFLRAHGAREIAAFDTDRVLSLSSP